jgi:SulP family sulfate permease
MDAALDFAAASAFEKNIVQAIGSHPGLAHVCWFALPINRIDVTGTETMARLEKRLQEQQITLHISGMKLPVETALQRAGCLVKNPYLKMYRTDADAIEALAALKKA